jgi:hypothetical protein
MSLMAQRTIEQDVADGWHLHASDQLGADEHYCAAKDASRWLAAAS